METKKRASTKTEASVASQRSPLRTFRVEDVAASIFAREHNGVTYHSVSFTRGYKDTSGQTKYTKSFDRDDLSKIVSVAQQAAEWLNRQTS